MSSFFFVFLVLWSWIRLPNISYLSEQSFWNLSNSFGNIQQMTAISYVNLTFVKFFEIYFPYISLIFFRGSHFYEIFYLVYPTFCSSNFWGPSPKNLITLFGHPLLRGAARVPRLQTEWLLSAGNVGLAFVSTGEDITWWEDLWIPDSPLFRPANWGTTKKWITTRRLLHLSPIKPPCYKFICLSAF